jgi:hypothetical protein
MCLGKRLNKWHRLAKIYYGPTFHLGITGSDDDVTWRRNGI